MRKLSVVAVTILAILVILFVFKDLVIKASVESGVALVTGLKLNIQSFRVGLISQMVGIKNLRVFNPAGYEDKVMLDMPEIYVDFDLKDIIGGIIHLEEVRINMNEFYVVKNENGELNLDSLKVVQAQKNNEEPAGRDKAKAPDIQVDVLELKVGKVIYKDYSKGGKPTVREFNVNIDERFENIRDPYTLFTMILVRTLAKTTIARLANFDLSGLESTVSESLKAAQKAAKEAIKQATEQTEKMAKEAAAKTQNMAQEAAKQAQETMTKTADELKDALKMPFGGDSK